MRQDKKNNSQVKKNNFILTYSYDINLLDFPNHLQHNMISSCLILTIFLYRAALQRVAAL